MFYLPTVRANVGKVILFERWPDIQPQDTTGSFHFPAKRLMYSQTWLQPPPMKASTFLLLAAQKFMTIGRAVRDEQFVFPNTNCSSWLGRMVESLLMSSTAMGMAAAVVRPTSHSPVIGAKAAIVTTAFSLPLTSPRCNLTISAQNKKNERNLVMVRNLMTTPKEKICFLTSGY